MKSITTRFLPLLALCALLALPANAMTARLSSSIAGRSANNIDTVEVPVASIPVNTLNDELNQDGDCSLREAISAANSNAASDACQAGEGGTTIDTITFTITGTISLNSGLGDLDVSPGGPLVIQGDGAITISGNNSTRIFAVNTGAKLTLDKLSMKEGATADGGGIYNSGVLTIEGSTLSNSHAWSESTGGGGGIYNTGTLTVLSSTLSSNTAFYHSGGGIYNLGKLTISDSTLNGNGAAHDGGGIYNTGPLTITNSTLSVNWANYGGGGGFYNYTGTVFLTNSTLKANAALKGGGIYNHPVGNVYITNSTLYGNIATSEGGGIYNQGTLTASNATLTHNETVNGFGGGIRSQGQLFTLNNTIIANNTSMLTGPDCYLDTAFTEGYNLIGDLNDCLITPTTGDLTGIDPGLGPLQDNGGPTYTQALLTGSLAIDHGNPEGCKDYTGNLVASDQRGFARTGRCDIGAYELQPPVIGPEKVYLPSIFNGCTPSLLFDDFSTPNNGWPVFEDQNVRFEYLDQEYRILVKTTTYGWIAGPEFLVTDFVMEVDLRNATGLDGTSGLIFGLSSDGLQKYSFEINSTGNYAIAQIYSDGYQSIKTVLAQGASASIYPGTAINHLKIERKGSLILAYANGQLLNILRNHSYIGERTVGLAALPKTQPNLDIRFDNFALYPIGCGRASTLSVNGMESSELKIFPFNPVENWGDDSLHGGNRR